MTSGSAICFPYIQQKGSVAAEVVCAHALVKSKAPKTSVNRMRIDDFMFPKRKKGCQDPL